MSREEVYWNILEGEIHHLEKRIKDNGIDITVYFVMLFPMIYVLSISIRHILYCENKFDMFIFGVGMTPITIVLHTLVSSIKESFQRRKEIKQRIDEMKTELLIIS